MKWVVKYKKIPSDSILEINKTCFAKYITKKIVLIPNQYAKEGIFVCYTNSSNKIVGDSCFFGIDNKYDIKPKDNLTTINKYLKLLPIEHGVEMKKISYNDYDDPSAIFESISEIYPMEELLNIESINDIYVIHKITGWQQIYNDYFYRGIETLITNTPMAINSNHRLECKYDLNISEIAKSQFNDLLTFLNATDYRFTMQLFLYMLFSKCKSLFKQYKTANINVEKNGFAINMNKNTLNNSANEIAIDYIKKMNNNFFGLATIGKSNEDLKEFEFVSSLNKEFQINYSQIKKCASIIYKMPLSELEFHLKSSRLKLKDFPVFKYKDKFFNSSRNTINISTLISELNSKLSFIYYDIANKDNFFINISIAENFNTEFKSINTRQYPQYGFQAIILDYLNYVANILNKQNNILCLEESQNKLTKYCTPSFYNNQIEPAINKYIYEMMNTETFTILHLKILFKKIKGFKWSDFDDLLFFYNTKDEERFTILRDLLYENYWLYHDDLESLDEDTTPLNMSTLRKKAKQISKTKKTSHIDSLYPNNKEYISKLKEQLGTNIVEDIYQIKFKKDEKKALNNILSSMQTSNKNLEKVSSYHLYEIKCELKKYMYEKYMNCILHQCILPKKHSPTYFNDLYKKALNELSTSDTNKVSASRYAFLLTMLESFNQYLEDQMPEQVNQFKDIYDETKELLHTLCKTEDYGTDKYWIKLFAEYLQTEIKQKNIIDVHSNKDAEIGWIDERKGQIYLKNTGKFYDNFMIYAQQCGSNIYHSKTAFIREVLFANHVVLSRKDGERKRYDVERKINDAKQNVIAVIHNTLTSYLN